MTLKITKNTEFRGCFDKPIEEHAIKSVSNLMNALGNYADQCDLKIEKSYREDKWCLSVECVDEMPIEYGKGIDLGYSTPEGRKQYKENIKKITAEIKKDLGSLRRKAFGDESNMVMLRLTELAVRDQVLE